MKPLTAKHTSLEAVTFSANISSANIDTASASLCPEEFRKVTGKLSRSWFLVLEKTADKCVFGCFGQASPWKYTQVKGRSPVRVLQAISAEEKERIEKEREERLTPPVDLWPFKAALTP